MGYENLRNLVLNYLGVANQEQQQSAQEYQQSQNINIQKQLSTLQSSRPKTNETNKEKDYDVQRSGTKPFLLRTYHKLLHKIEKF